jgi:cob(I)alamin adenosyltransferase
MGYRLSKIYTRTGDEGYTSLGDNRLSKDDLLIEAVGTLDELNSMIGVVISLKIPDESIHKALTQIQNELFDMGGELHFPDKITITPEKVFRLEEELDTWNETLPPLKEFILPRGNMLAATTHVARTVCRRAERCLVRLHRQVALHNVEMLRYLNRLSDVLFVVARVLGKEGKEQEVLWEHERKK